MTNKIILIAGFLFFALNSYGQTIFLNDYAIDQFEKNQIDSAFALLDKAQKEDSTYFVTYYNRAVFYRELGKTDLAINQFSKAIHFNPMDTDSYMNRGILFADKNQTNKALEDFTAVIKNEPNRKEAHFNIGLIYFNSGNLKDAENKSLQCIQLDSNYASAYFLLAKINFQNEKFSVAYDYLNKCISINNKNYEYFEMRGVMNLMKGDKIHACEDLEQAIKFGSKDPIIIDARSKECK